MAAVGKVWEPAAEFPWPNVKAEQHIGQNVYPPSAFSITCVSECRCKANKCTLGMKYDYNKYRAALESCKLYLLLLPFGYSALMVFKLGEGEEVVLKMNCIDW